VLYLNYFIKIYTTYIVFAENQLSPETFSLSLQIVNHSSFMQQTRIRSSKIQYYISSTCLRLDLLVSGLIYITIALLILIFITPTFSNLSLLYKLTCWTLIQKVRYYHPFMALTACRFKISVLFQHHYFGYFFTFPSRYYFDIDYQ